MNLPRLHVERRWFVGEHWRRVILRGVNLGGGHQEDPYPTMSRSANARRPADGIMWTLFFAGSDFARILPALWFC